MNNRNEIYPPTNEEVRNFTELTRRDLELSGEIHNYMGISKKNWIEKIVQRNISKFMVSPPEDRARMSNNVMKSIRKQI